MNRAKLTFPDDPEIQTRWAWNQTLSYLTTAIAQSPSTSSSFEIQARKRWMSRIWHSANIETYWNATLQRYPILKNGGCPGFSSTSQPGHPKTKEVINDVIHIISDEEVEIFSEIWSGLDPQLWLDPSLIGWIKQFFHIEDLERAICRGKSIDPRHLSVATQLFTPRWIARFLIENTLGKRWLKSGFSMPDKANWPLLVLVIDDTQGSQFLNQAKNSSPDSVESWMSQTFCDPACGAGHLLIEAFDLWLDVALSEVHDTQKIIELATQWLTHQCVGLDIDPDVTRVASWGLIRKLEQRLPGIDPSRISSIRPKILTIQPPSESVQNIWPESRQADQLGSLLRPPNNLQPPQAAVDSTEKQSHRPWIWISALQEKYDFLVTNPPYMQNRSLPDALKKLAKERVPKGKTDLFALFLDQGLHLLKPGGQLGLLTMQSWMFLKSYAPVRNRMIHDTQLELLAHIGPGAFEDLGAYNALTVAFTATHNRISHDKNQTVEHSKPATFLKLNRSHLLSEKLKDFYNADLRIHLDPKIFLKYPDHLWLYTLPNPAQNQIIHSPNLASIARLRQGLATTDNKQFVRRWFEVPKNQIGFGFPSAKIGNLAGYSWFPYHKGGKFRRWYGNNEFVIHFENEGENLIELVRKKYPRISDPEFVIKNRNYYFREGIVWSLFGFDRFSVRYKEAGYIFDVSGASAFPKQKDLLWTLAYLGSNVALYYLQAIAPTVNFQVGDLSQIPCIPPKRNRLARIETITRRCIELCRIDWNERQTSWEFDPGERWTEKFTDGSLDLAWRHRSEELLHRRNELQELESEIHSEFIQLHQLQKHVAASTPESDLTLAIPDKLEAARELISAIILELGGAAPWQNPTDFQTSPDIPLWTLNVDSKECFLPDSDNTQSREILRAIRNWIRSNWPHRDIDDSMTFLSNAIKANAASSSSSPEIRLCQYLKSQWKTDHNSRYSKHPTLWLINSGPRKSLQIWVPYWHWTSETLAAIKTALIEPLIQSVKLKKLHPLDYEEINSLHKKIQSAPPQSMNLKWQDGIVSNHKRASNLLD